MTKGGGGGEAEEAIAMEDSCATCEGSSSFRSRRRRRGRRRRKVQGETAAEVVGGGGEGEKKRKYTGVRLRNRGRWVAEVREPNKRTRTWLGSYASPVAAARAYDTAVYCLYGSTARLNFPGEISRGDITRERDPAKMRQKAMEVGTSVDAALLETPPAPPPVPESEKPDLNLRSNDDDDDVKDD